MTTIPNAQPGAMRFNGPAYDPERDDERLSGQILRVFNLMRDGAWRTLEQIAATTGDPHASISAQLRHLRKERFGAHTVNRSHITHGLFAYQLVVSTRIPPAANADHMTQAGETR